MQYTDFNIGDYGEPIVDQGTIYNLYRWNGKPLDDGRLRLTQTPILVDDELSFGDIIEASRISDDRYRFVRVVAKSKFKAVTLVVGPLSDAKKAELWDFAVSKGVTLEPLLDGIVIINMPPNTHKNFMKDFGQLIDRR